MATRGRPGRPGRVARGPRVGTVVGVGEPVVVGLGDAVGEAVGDAVGLADAVRDAVGLAEAVGEGVPPAAHETGLVSGWIVIRSVPSAGSSTIGFRSGELLKVSP